MAEPLPLSVVVIARNESRNLPRCLGSVRDWVAEMVVVLNNTTDDSETVSRGLGAVVHHVPWQGYRDTKNAALALASQRWVLSLDADEEVSPALRDALATITGHRPMRRDSIRCWTTSRRTLARRLPSNA